MRERKKTQHFATLKVGLGRPWFAEKCPKYWPNI